ncbi:MAG: site-specific tyrosine recombinase/integron integrase [Patescibacteria group bacterium]
MSANNFANLLQLLKLKGFSQKTIKSYLYYNTIFLDFTRKSPREINSFDIKRYLEYLADKGCSSSTLNLVYNALKMYYGEIYRRRFFVNIPRAKKAKTLPVVLSKKEIKKILGQINNVKHKLFLALMYASGLRISEAVNLKVQDLDFDSGFIYVRQGKGQKDRKTLLPKILLDVLKKYITAKNGDQYVFESERGGKLTERAIQKVFFNALKLSGIKKQATCHSLRHSFATHLLEAGTDIRYIQELLGHRRLETTQVYTKVAGNKLQEIRSPLDCI